MAISTPTDTRINGDIQQLQRTLNSIQTDLNEFSITLNRLNNLLQQVIKLNNLKSKP